MASTGIEKVGRVVVVAQGDCATALLSAVARGREVLAVATLGPESRTWSGLFAKRCADLDIECSMSRHAATLKAAMEQFAPDIIIVAPSSAGEVQDAAESIGAPVHHLSFGATGGRWPEFLPIWWNWENSPVTLSSKDCLSAAATVDLGEDETAVTLHRKHHEAAAALVSSLLSGEVARRAATGSPGAVPGQHVSLDWDDATVDRFLRASCLPPNDPAIVEDPFSGDQYFIESMPQFHTFKAMLQAAGGKDGEANKGGAYTADTHWYSNVGGSIVKLTDNNIHTPKKVGQCKATLVPGAAIGAGAREKLRMNEPFIGPNAEKYCSEVIESTWIGVEGPFVKRFEAHLARICGCAAACAVQSGTAALYGAMKALGVSDSTHHVLVPAFTCAAAADAVVHAGGTPISVDCELDTYGMSAEAVRAHLDKNPEIVGVVVAHCYGVPIRDYLEIARLCQEKGLWICEDCCETYGALMRGPDPTVPQVKCGSLATLSVVSVRSEKMVGVGEGGAIVGNDTTLVARARWWCSRAPCRGGGLWRVYEHEGVGQNFRLPEMLGALGTAGAEMLPTVIERKRAIHAWYEKYLSRRGLEGLKLQNCSEGDTAVWWINAVLLPEDVNAEEVGMSLMKSFPDIEIRPGFFPMDQMTIFQYDGVTPCTNTHLLYRRLLCLPSSVHLKERSIERICAALQESLDGALSKSA